jgi:hypothetical protein
VSDPASDAVDWRHAPEPGRRFAVASSHCIYAEMGDMGMPQLFNSDI